MALGAYAPVGGDVRGFLANPAGLPGMRDWDVELVTSLPVTGGGFIFDGAAVGKRLFGTHALALQYSPGSELDFVLPATVRIRGLDFAADKKITYTEPFAAAYAIALAPGLSVGIDGRLRTEVVNDPELQFVDTTIVSVTNEARRTSWLMDLGVRYQPAPFMELSLVGRGIPIVPGTSLPDEFQSYERPDDASLEAGVQIIPVSPVRLALVGGTLGTGSVGGEWRPFRFPVALRTAAYFDNKQSPALMAVAAGAGWSVGPLDFDVAWLHFTNQENRKGFIAAPDLTGSAIRSISMSPFAPDRLSCGLRMSLGNIHEQIIRIVEVQMLTAVYPASYETLAYRPLGKVRVRNVSTSSVEVKAAFFLDHLMDAPTESAVTVVPPGEEADIPLMAVFNENVRRIASVSVQEGDVTVGAAPLGEEEDRSQTRVVVRGRNDWDGNAESLRFFVRPADPEVLRTTRDILLASRDSLAAGGLELFSKARALFNAFAGKLVYVNDPKLTADYVQYPDETLRLHGGDCDDMTVCFASLLGSIGIATAFVDVVPPDNPGDAHIYLLFDTGLDPKYASNIAQNPKRYVVRKDRDGKETVWIPVETTVIMKGFDEAWNRGAEEQYQNAEVDLGLAKGWVHIVDVGNR
ncbi:MAG TPA: hypothetical protein VF889_08685 [Bacteroidota bacterium]